MITMSAKARKAAKSLAIAYNAFHEAVAKHNDNGILVWAIKLNELQNETGIILHANLEQRIETTRRRVERADQEAERAERDAMAVDR